MEEIFFVTHNTGKVAEAKRCLKNINFKIYDFELDEPRSDDVTAIATAKVNQAYEILKKPCIALDAGFFIDELNGFPKAFVNFTLETIGLEGILKLMENKRNRNCSFKECLAYHDGNEIHYFYGNESGELSNKIHKAETDKKWSDLWYVYKPKGQELTLAQMSDEQREDIKKNNEAVSAMQAFAYWYKNFKGDDISD